MLATLTLSLALFAGGTPAPGAAAPPAATEASPGDATELRLALRDLWTNHIFWVRSYVFATHYEDDAGATAAEAAAVANARAIADAIVPFYGQDAADALFELLAGHYGAVKEFAAASAAGDAQGQEAASQALSANAEAIADFLDGANPHLPKDAVLPILVAHGGHHLQQIRAVHAGDFAAEAEVWTAMLGHVYAIADALANALAEQFPDRVNG
ncbi:MAG TPA: hypothetical protein VK002_13870 [Rubricoccaceae bacterium]|jgi:hypothetical protein|nr:hypothetical protein [Rubricoccaceae bacterium]